MVQCRLIPRCPQSGILRGDGEKPEQQPYSGPPRQLPGTKLPRTKFINIITKLTQSHQK